MINQTVVSVVIIFLNAEPFLAEAVESVLAQTYQGWELLLVDDGTIDGSTSVARAYAASHPRRVLYLEHLGHANRGMSAARNLGVAHARGRYVAFLDADDVWVPHTLAEQVAMMERHPGAALVYGPIEYWHSWTGSPDDRGRDRVERLGVPADRMIEPPSLLPLFLQDKAAVPSGLLVRREAIEQVGGFEEQFRGEYEDQVFCAKICLRLPVVAAARCWYRYRQHPDSCVSRAAQSGQAQHARRRFLEWLEAYVEARGVNHPELRRALRAELWPHRHPRLHRATTRARQLAGVIRGLLSLQRRVVQDG
jgi:glycosyltransferase involved in cell wall biosynthesis